MADNKNVTQEPEANEALDKVTGFWNKYGKQTGIALAAIVVIVGGFFAYKAFVSGPNEQKAQEAIFKAQEYYGQDSIKLALNGDNVNPGFLKVISKYGGTQAGNLANFYAGSCYLKLGDFANAIKYLKDFSTSSKQVQAKAYGLLGDAYAESGKTSEAAEQYVKAGNHFADDDFNSAEYLFRAAFLYQSINKTKEAIDLFKTIKEKYPNSTRGADVEKYLAKLGEVE